MASQHYLEFLRGANSAVSPFVMEDDSLTVLSGATVSYKLGAILKDLGYIRIGDVADSTTKPITGLHNFRQDPSTEKILLTKDDSTSDDTQLFYNNSGTWTEIAAAETVWLGVAGANVEMENFIGYCFIVGHSPTDGFLPIGTLTNTTFSNATNLTNAPTGKFIKRYRDRLYIANCRYGAVDYPYRVRISAIPAAGVLGDWDFDDNFFDVDYAEQITGMGENWDYLVVFTEYSAYLYDQTSLKKEWDVGCSNHRTIHNSGAYMIWANRDGVWVSTDGARPQNIAGPIKDFIRSGTPTSFFATVIDEEYHLYVGNVTVNGVDYANCVCSFNINTSSWRWRELADTMTIFARYNYNGDDRFYMGDDAGNVWDKSKYTDGTMYYSDSYIDPNNTGEPITALVETKPYYLDDPSIEKALTKITVYSERAVGAKIGFRLLNRNVKALNKYKPLGQLTRYINHFDSVGEEFNMIQFVISETSKNPYFSIFGMSIEYEASAIPPSNKK